ncbi:MAG: PD-(D/E)XK nuclease family protein [Chloroflexi bacterium]|nr:PD-(D/E)XK nuclease family protein [Chloroflexota bacterium]
MTDPQTPQALDAEIEEFLERSFDDNYQRLLGETGRGLSPDGRQFARQQVLLYWRKLSEVARTITDTEVRLTLPNQRTPQGRPYAIEGIVDIVREEGYTVLYDIKSLDADHIRQLKEWYEKQLNVYAYIWQTLRRERLNQTAIIATSFPTKVAEALASGDAGHLAYALAQWNPIIPLDFHPSRVGETIAEFGAAVDAIEEGRFAPRPVEDLSLQEGPGGQQFATAVCRNCDARFSCASYRQWALGSTSRVERDLRRHFEDTGDDADQEAWRTANLEATPTAADLLGDFGRDED